MAKPHPRLPPPRQPRTVQQGARGRDVVAYKGGLVHAGLRPGRLVDSPTFGHTMRHEVERFQREHGLEPDGVIGPHTYKHLINWVGDYGRRLIMSIDRLLLARTVRERFVQNLLWSAQSRLYPYWIYDQVRPIPVNHPYREVDQAHIVETDCSGFIVLMAKWSGAPSPVPSFGYDGGGSSYTMDGELARVAFPEPGDLIVYYNEPGHVVGCIGYPYAVSFGAEPGPIKLDSRYRSDATFRRFLPA